MATYILKTPQLYQKVLKCSEIKLNWRIQITIENPVVFAAPPALNVLVPAFLWLQCKFHHILGKQNGRRENLDILRLRGARRTHFPTISMILATFCTHQNHCYLYAFFSSQPQSTKIEQKLTRSLHFIGFTSAVGVAFQSTWAFSSAATHWRKRTQIWDH